MISEIPSGDNPGPGRASMISAMKYRVYLEQDEDGVFVASCPALPGCISQGQTRDEAHRNIREAVQLYRESLREHGESIPLGIE